MNLTQLDPTTLTQHEQMQLAPFYHSWNRPYPPAMTWRECVAEGLTRREWTSCGLDEIQEGTDELFVMSSFHLDEDGMVVPGEGDRADWMQRRINAWSRR